MKYKLTIESDSLEEIFASVSNLNKPSLVTMQGGTSLSEETELKKERKARGPNKLKSEVVVPITEQVVLADPTPAAVAVALSEATTTPYEVVKKATLDLIKAKGKQTVLDILAKFDIKAATELKPSDYDAYLTQVTIAQGKA